MPLLFYIVDKAVGVELRVELSIRVKIPVLYSSGIIALSIIVLLL